MKEKLREILKEILVVVWGILWWSSTTCGIALFVNYIPFVNKFSTMIGMLFSSISFMVLFHKLGKEDNKTPN